jgi:hypothetical protein
MLFRKAAKGKDAPEIIFPTEADIDAGLGDRHGGPQAAIRDLPEDRRDPRGRLRSLGSRDSSAANRKDRGPTRRRPLSKR